MSGPLHDQEHGEERTGEIVHSAEQAPVPASVSSLIALQRSAGNQAVAGLIQRAPTFWDKVGMFFGADTYEATVAGEKVLVANETEEKDAARIIKSIASSYGIDVSSIKAMKALKSGNKSAPKAMLDKIKSRPWLYRELRAVERALKHFSRVLGAARAFSTRAAVPQELVSIGKLETRLGVKAGKTVWKPSVMGTYFSASKAFAMYKHGETATPDFSDLDKQIEGTAIHEIAHGIFDYAEADWLATFDYWLDADTPRGKAGAEAPPTDYGQTSVAEDLAESVMLYFLDRPRLEKSCPKRCAFIRGLIEGWTPKPPKPPVGDFPVPEKDPETMLA